MLIDLSELERVDIEAALLNTIKYAKEAGCDREAICFSRTLISFRDKIAIARAHEKGEEKNV